MKQHEDRREVGGITVGSVNPQPHEDLSWLLAANQPRGISIETLDRLHFDSAGNCLIFEAIRFQAHLDSLRLFAKVEKKQSTVCVQKESLG